MTDPAEEAVVHDFFFLTIETADEDVIFRPHVDVEDVAAGFARGDGFVTEGEVGVEGVSGFVAALAGELDGFLYGAEGAGVGLLRADDGGEELVFDADEVGGGELLAEFGGIGSEEVAEVAAGFGIEFTVFAPEEVEVVGALVLVDGGGGAAEDGDVTEGDFTFGGVAEFEGEGEAVVAAGSFGDTGPSFADLEIILGGAFEGDGVGVASGEFVVAFFEGVAGEAGEGADAVTPEVIHGDVGVAVDCFFFEEFGFNNAAFEGGEGEGVGGGGDLVAFFAAEFLWSGEFFDGERSGLIVGCGGALFGGFLLFFSKALFPQQLCILG